MHGKSSAIRFLRLSLALIGLLASSSALATTIVVTNTADVVTGCATTGTGQLRTPGCTLRDAIIFSNAHPQPFLQSNVIQFNVPGSGVHTITLSTDLPTITAAVVIDGYSQPGASPNTLAVGNDAVLLVAVTLDPQSLAKHIFIIDDGTGSGFSGRTIGGSVVRGLVLNDSGNDGAQAILLLSCCNVIQGNFIGTDPTGSMAGSPFHFVGGGAIDIDSAANVIGGTTPADRNVVAGIESGLVNVRGAVNRVEGNYIGINAAGTKALPCPANAIFIQSQANTIGGPTAAHGNVISGCGGIQIVGPDGFGNVVESNFIGTDATGLLPIPNFVGVSIQTGAEGNSILRNRIAFNSSDGVSVLDESLSGGAISRFNSILSNSITSNGGLGVNLAVSFQDGVTPNDPCDADDGPNALQNYPVLTTAFARSNTTEIEGTLNSQPNKEYLVQLFSNSACDPSGFGEGETFIDEFFVTTDTGCNVSFKDIVPLTSAPLGSFITATATDSDGNTSEFSACLQVGLVKVGIRTHIFLVEGPIRVAPGIPVELRFHVETEPPGQVGDFTGDAIVSDDQGHTCRARVSAGGEGECSLTFDQPGNYRVRAEYLGNATFEESVSPPVPVLVGDR